MNEQLALGLQLQDSARFSNFVAGDNSELLECLEGLAPAPGGAQVFCWGKPGSGRSHLLQACCHRLSRQGAGTAYLALDDIEGLPTALLDGWEHQAVVCLDNIESLAARPAWQEAVFHLYNRLRDSGNSLVVSADCAPAHLPLALPDLKSRLGAGLVYQLRSLNEAQSLEALQLRADRRGFELPEETGRYLLKRVPRDLPALMTMLERLDAASLAARRRLTIPFVKTALDL